MSNALDNGQRLVVGFFAFCSALGLLNVVLGLLARTKWGLIIALAQGVSALLAAAAAWNIYRLKAVGWGIGMLVALDSLSGIANPRIGFHWLTVALACAMVAVVVWLWLPEVRTKFGLKKVFS
jgi:hypothetical protein